MTRTRPLSAVRRARLERGMSIERCAVAAGISGGWLRQVERHPDVLTPRVAALLERVLGVPAVDLLAERP